MLDNNNNSNNNNNNNSSISSSSSSNAAHFAAGSQAWGVTTALLLGVGEAVMPPVLLAAVADCLR